MADTVQHKLGRNRPPRVQITYDVEIGDAIEKAEIPFVVGIMADLSGMGASGGKHAKGLKDSSRGFVEIDRDNFADVMAKIAPAVAIKGALDSDGHDADGRLVLRSLDDFNPAALKTRIGTVKTLYEQRSALRDILTKLDSNDELHEYLLTQVKQKTLGDLGKAAQVRLTALDVPAADPAAGAKPAAGRTEGATPAAAKEAAKSPTSGAAAGGQAGGKDA